MTFGERDAKKQGSGSGGMPGAGERGRRVRSIRVQSAVALLALALSGCAALGGKPAPLDTYELTAPALTAHSHSRKQILIPQPAALKALDSQNIVIKTGARSIQYLKGAQWADRLPLIVQARLAETFQHAGSFAGVGKPGEGLAIDYQVVTEIRAFDVRADQGRQAEVEISVRLLNDRNGEVRATKVFTASAPLSGSGNGAYVAALDHAFGQAAEDIVRWTDSAI